MFMHTSPCSRRMLQSSSAAVCIPLAYSSHSSKDSVSPHFLTLGSISMQAATLPVMHLPKLRSKKVGGFIQSTHWRARMFSTLNLSYLTSPQVNTRPENIYSICNKVPFHPLYVEVILFSLVKTYIFFFLRKWYPLDKVC